jgi:uncharacterized protein DUF4153
MIPRALPVATILSAGIGMGFAGDQLLRASGEPGLNMFLLFVGLAASVWTVSQCAEPLSREASTWIGVGLLCGATLMWRGSEILRFGSFLAACTAFALPALHAGRGWIKRSGVLSVVEAGAGAGLHAAFAGFRLFAHEQWGAVGSDTSRGAARSTLSTAFRGVRLALIPLVVFGALFISADEVFATMIGDFVRLDLQVFTSHLALIAVLSWLACGYLVGFASGTRLDVIRGVLPEHPSLSVAEVATALALVDALFLGFVIVQFRYLFGGGTWVEITPDLTYAEYARAGFFQLIVAVALAIPWLLVTHSLMDDRGPKSRPMFAAFAGVNILLLVAIVASAIQRMLAYQTAYGLTEDRVVGTAILVWLTVVVIWFGATVLSGRRDRFAFGGLATAFVLVGALQVINPAAMVARHNLDRSEELGGVDVEHLGSLGSDAAPLLVSRLGELPREAQCVVASRLLDSWGPERPVDWRNFNVSESRAREAVNSSLVALRSLAGVDGCAVVEQADAGM